MIKVKNTGGSMKLETFLRDAGTHSIYCAVCDEKTLKRCEEFKGFYKFTCTRCGKISTVKTTMVRT